MTAKRAIVTKEFIPSFFIYGSDVQRKIADGNVHVWIASLKQHAGAVMFAEILSSVEKMESSLIIDKCRRKNFIVGRVILKTILSYYLSSLPAEVGIVRDKNGKPALSEEHNGLHFNVSHSHDVWVCAISTEANVGIDVERIRERPYLYALLSADEHFFINSLPYEHRTEMLFKVWTLKEAVLKALSLGLESIGEIEAMPTISGDTNIKIGENLACDKVLFFQFQPMASYMATLVSLHR